jgi:hypothetical protein
MTDSQKWLKIFLQNAGYIFSHENNLLDTNEEVYYKQTNNTKLFFVAFWHKKSIKFNYNARLYSYKSLPNGLVGMIEFDFFCKDNIESIKQYEEKIEQLLLKIE